MRITPLHNIREPGLIPNGFQKEEASPPAPDPAMQPEMRNRAEAQTDTRHAIEFLNPRARLETNGANRTNSTFPPKIEMGRERQQKSSAAGGMQEKPAQSNDPHERLLRILLGENSSPQPVARDTREGDKPERTGIATKPLEMEGTGDPAHRKIEVYHQAAQLNDLVAHRYTHVPESEPPAPVSLTHEQRRAIEAYRTTQTFAPGGSVHHEA